MRSRFNLSTDIRAFQTRLALDMADLIYRHPGTSPAPAQIPTIFWPETRPRHKTHPNPARILFLPTSLICFKSPFQHAQAARCRRAWLVLNELFSSKTGITCNVPDYSVSISLAPQGATASTTLCDERAKTAPRSGNCAVSAISDASSSDIAAKSITSRKDNIGITPSPDISPGRGSPAIPRTFFCNNYPNPDPFCSQAQQKRRRKLRLFFIITPEIRFYD
tara:strand:- start:524 stop:1186 length:663 start_codon:yes stop_codon:yes gene_type:complete